MQYHPISREGRVMQPPPSSVLLQNGLRSKGDGTSELRQKKCRRRLFDLELPADEYIYSEGQKQKERGFGVLGELNCHQERNCQVTHERSIILSRVRTSFNVDAVRSTLHLGRAPCLTDLNEPIQVDAASALDPVDIKSYQCSSTTGVSSEDVPQSYEPVQKAPSRLPPSDPLTGMQRKRRIFGVEISESKDNASITAPCTPSPLRVIPQSPTANSALSSASPWSKIPSSMCSDFISAQEQSCSNTFALSNKTLKISLQNLEVTGGKFHVHGSSSSIPTIRAEASFENDLCPGFLLDSKEPQVCCPSVGYDYSNGNSGNNGNNSASEQFVRHSPSQYVKGPGCIDAKPYNDINPDVASGRQDRQGSMFLRGLRKPENPCIEWSSWMRGKSRCNGESFKQNESSFHLTLESLKNYSWQVADKAEMGDRHSHNLMQDITLSKGPHSTDQSMSEGCNCISSRKILGVPIFTKSCTSTDVSSLSSTSCTSTIDGVNVGRIGIHYSTTAHDPVSHNSGEPLTVTDWAADKRLTSEISGLRHHIDLNSSIPEEEVPSTPSITGTSAKLATLIDLEAPLVFESKEDNCPRGEYPEESINTKLLETFENEPPVLHDVSIRDAAEAIIDFSTSHAHTLMDDTACFPSIVCPSNCLDWFADLITSNEIDLDNDTGTGTTGTLLSGKDEVCHKDFVPEGIDFFEFMTLKLTKTEIEECCCEPQELETQKSENKSLPARRPWEGQARRGRQRKDFQRDVLPGLSSLSKHEVVKDLQTIEGLVRATGYTWEPSFAKANTKRGSMGRGRKRLGDSATPLPVSTVHSPPIQQSNYRDVGIEEKSLIGWGKKTKRPPRPRCPFSNSPQYLK